MGGRVKGWHIPDLVDVSYHEAVSFELFKDWGMGERRGMRVSV